MAILLLAGATAATYAQDVDKKNVPAPVRQALNKSYPNARDVDWERRGANYVADFDFGNTDYKVTYSGQGRVLVTEKDIPNTKLPSVIAKNIKLKYPKARIDDVDWINTAGKISYKVDIEGTPDVNVWYTADGKFIKEIAD